MNERFPTREKKWRSRQRVVKAVGNTALTTKLDAADIRLPDPDETNGYEMLGARTHLTFVDALDAVKVHEADEQSRRELALAPSVEQGYHVMARNIGFAAKAYKKFLKDTPWHNGSVEELGALLWSEQAYTELVTNLATVPGETNVPLETAYNLLTPELFKSAYDADQPPFVVSETESGRLEIRPDRDLRDKAYEEIEPSDYTKFETCSAHDVLLRPLWENMILEASIDPNLFAADLGLVNTT
jgi:hypothetical protein